METREPDIVFSKKKLTIAEYLELAKTTTEKYEFYEGEVFAMAGAGIQHNTIVMNVLKSLLLQLDGKPCRPFGSDQRVHIERNTLYLS